jgi:preprotein translocase subunit SecG
MTAIVLTIHLMIALALVIVILLQRSEGGGLGIGGGGGGGGGMGSFMSARGTANLLTRTTAILAACFMATSILLAILAGNTGTSSIVDRPSPTSTAPSGTGPAAPVSQ